MNQGIDIEVRLPLGLRGEPGVTPRDIFSASTTSGAYLRF